MNSLSSIRTFTGSFAPPTISNGTVFSSEPTSSWRRPMKRLIDMIVRLGFTTAWRLAAWPTRRSPDSVNATTDGVVRPPSGLLITTGLPPSKTATTELVVPRSIPMTFSVVFAITRA